MKRTDYSSWFFPIITVLLLVFSLPVIDDILNKLFVSSYFKHIKSWWVNDFIVFGIFALLIGYTYLNFGKGVVKKKIVWAAILVLMYYVYHRCFSEYYLFTPFTFSPKLFYADIILPIFICLRILTFRKPVQQKKFEQKQPLFVDEPINDVDADVLGYSEYAKQLAQRINSNIVENSFAIGVNGKWGSGKTSFLNILSSCLMKNQVIEVQFNPWRSVNNQAIAKDFFDEVLAALESHQPDLYRSILKYSEKILDVEDSTIIKSSKRLLGLKENQSPIKELHEGVNKILNNIGKKLVIYIDDLDRLDEGEVKEVLRLIRNTANFYNTFFVVAYDREYIVNATKKFTQFGSEWFLEKIFQLEISLPHFNKRILTKKLFENLKKIVGEEYHPLIGKELDQDENQLIIGGFYLYNWLDNLRDVTRISNSLALNLEKLMGEVVFADFLRLELLRMKFPTVYELLHKETEKFLVIDKDQGYVYCYFLKMLEGEKPYIRFKDSLENTGLYHHLNTPLISLEKQSTRKIIKLLAEIFNNENSYSHNAYNSLSVVHPSKFKRYFSYAVPQGKLSEIEFSRARELDIENFKEKIKEWLDNGMALELFSRFKIVRYFDDFDDFQKIIRGIFYMYHLHFDLKNTSYWKIDASDILIKIKTFVRSRKLQEPNNEIKKLINEIFSSAQPPYLIESGTLKQWYPEIPEDFIISQDEIAKWLLGYLKRHCQVQDKLNQQFWNLFYACKVGVWINDGGNSYREKQQFLPDAVNILLEFVSSKDIDGFLFDIITYKPFEEDKFCLIDGLLDIFSSMEKFYDFIHTLDKTDSIYIDEFKEFLEAFKNENYKVYITFNFKIIPISDKFKKQ